MDTEVTDQGRGDCEIKALSVEWQRVNFDHIKFKVLLRLQGGDIKRNVVSFHDSKPRTVNCYAL